MNLLCSIGIHKYRTIDSKTTSDSCVNTVVKQCVRCEKIRLKFYESHDYGNWEIIGNSENGWHIVQSRKCKVCNYAEFERKRID
jgi:hypothetical protein